MTAEPDAVTVAAVAAADHLVELFDLEFSKRDPSTDAIRVALRQAGAVVTAAAPPALWAEVERMVEDVLRTYTGRAEHQKSSAGFEARGHLPRLRAALDVALAIPVHDQAELEAAEAEVAALERRHAETTSGLERAVVEADVPEVMRLRSEAEAVLPAQLEAARLRMLDLTIRRAEAVQRRPGERAREFELAREQAVDQVAAAQRSVEAAHAEFHLAQNRHDTAKQIAMDAWTLASQLREERTALAASQGEDGRSRLRRLAGLPAAEAVSS